MDDRPLARSEGLVTERFDDELVVYDQRSQTGHSLSADVASVWGRCDGRRSCNELARELGLDQQLVARSIQELESCGLLEGPAALRAPGYSRRQAMVRMAKVGGVAISAPLIYSVAIAPATAAASTCSPVTSGRSANGAFPCGNQQSTSCTQNVNNRGLSGTDPCCDSCTCYINSGAQTICAPTGCATVDEPCTSSAQCCSNNCSGTTPGSTCKL